MHTVLNTSQTCQNCRDLRLLAVQDGGTAKMAKLTFEKIKYDFVDEVKPANNLKGYYEPKFDPESDEVKNSYSCKQGITIPNRLVTHRLNIRIICMSHEMSRNTRKNVEDCKAEIYKNNKELLEKYEVKNNG